ncbi:GNAT family N-acetyltransferase [Eubacteriales bacterium OttesenSCG-928-N14]|nr:GNAT family N-acetyltransferase [Eubacteriales bacterium OttesenSCG-928-N14]
MLTQLHKSLPQYQIRPATQQDMPDIYQLQHNNVYYFMLEQGGEVTMEQCKAGVEELPPNTDAAQKHYILFYKDNRLHALLDYVEDYPQKQVAWIGLFMMDDDLQGQGIGKQLMQAFLSACKHEHYQCVQLGVIEGNTPALAFWQALGFVEIRRSQMQGHGDGTPLPVIVLEKQLQ